MSNEYQSIIDDPPLSFGKGMFDDSQYTDRSMVSEVSEISKTGKYVGFFPAVMNLLNSLVGAEILSISNTMTHCGFVVSVVLMTSIACLSYIATAMTVRLQYATKAESLNDMAKRLLGKVGSWALTILTLLFTFSCCVAYLIIGGNNIQSWLALVGHEEWMINTWKRALVIFIYSICLPAALTIPRKMTFLSIFSTFSIFCLALFVVILAYKVLLYLPKNGIDPTVMTATINLNFFSALAIYSLMFALPAICLPILKPTNPRISHRYRIIGTAFFSCYLFVLIPGTLGYLRFGNKTEEIILDNFDDSDVIIQVVRIAFFIVVTASYPVIGLSITSDLASIIFNMFEPATMPLKQRSITLIIANIPPVLIAMFCPSISPILAIGGALGGCLTNFFFPSLMWIANSGKKWYQGTNILCILLAAFGLISACVATYEALVSVITGESGD